jgi:hypothetical protein
LIDQIKAVIQSGVEDQSLTQEEREEIIDEEKERVKAQY